MYERLHAPAGRRAFFEMVEAEYEKKSTRLRELAQTMLRHENAINGTRVDQAAYLPVGSRKAPFQEQIEADMLLRCPDAASDGKKMTETLRGAWVVQALQDSAEYKQGIQVQRAALFQLADHDTAMNDARREYHEIERELQHLDAWVLFFARPPVGTSPRHAGEEKG